MCFPSPPNGSQKSPTEILTITVEILDAVYPEYQSISAYHADSNVPHTHSILNSVNSITGRKFSQSPSDLNRVKQKVNNILKKHGFEIITASANDFVDRTDYSDVEGFDFLELDETELITESDIEEFSPYIDTISGDSPLKIFCGQDYSDCCSTNYFGGNNKMNTNNYVPCTTQIQELPASTIETVPATVEMPKNSYPNTTVVTGPTFRIKGTPQSDFAGLSKLVSQTTAYAQEHQREAANLALAMQQYGQQRGYPSNVSVIAGPIFDLDLTGDISSDYYNSTQNMDDYGAKK